MHLIDTNIFLELLLNQEKKKLAQKILSQLEKGEIEAVISGYTLHSIEFILSIKKKNAVLKEFLQALIDFHHLSVYHTILEEDLEILNLMEQFPFDFDDANQYYIARKFNAEIITFDNHFKVIEDLRVHIL